MEQNHLGDSERAEAEAFFTEYIDSVKWVFAKTMKSIPHEYTVRWHRPDLDGMFCKFAEFIREYGYAEMFYRRQFMYYAIGEYKYWTMGDPIRGPKEVPRGQNTFILNRAKVGNIYGDNNRTSQSKTRRRYAGDWGSDERREGSGLLLRPTLGSGKPLVLANNKSQNGQDD